MKWQYSHKASFHKFGGRYIQFLLFLWGSDSYGRVLFTEGGRQRAEVLFGRGEGTF